MQGLYIHIPFCVKKCDYCDFLSFSAQDGCFEKYTDALISEMEEYAGDDISTVFIGGGTPSVLPSYLMEKICRSVSEKFNVGKDAEWTAEANPGTLNDEKIYTMAKCGINRISVGVQSFNDKELKAIGRIHDAKTAYDTVLDIKKSGISNISIDLMASLPYQTRESFRNSLITAVSLPVSHISVYSLIIEENTPIKEKYDTGVFQMPDDDEDRELYKMTGEYLEEHGFLRYEISNYAKDGFISRHNMNYWECGEYIGIGLGASSYKNGVRYKNTDNLSDYMNGKNAHTEKEIISKKDKMSEFMILGLRKTHGISSREFFLRFGLYPENVWGGVIDKFINLGLIMRYGDNYSLTDKGLDLSNTVMCEFL